MRILIPRFMLLLLVLLLPVPARAQDPTAAAPVSVRGVVRDKDGIPMKGVKAKYAGKVFVTDESGEFIFTDVKSGLLVVLFERAGFQTGFAIFGISPDETNTRDITLLPNQDCPAESDRVGPDTEISSDDYVEVTASGGALAGYSLRLQADGEVTWLGSTVGGMGTFPGHDHVEAAQARGLIQQFREAGFWELCGSYDGEPGVTDRSWMVTTVRIGNQIRRVSNYAGGAPEIMARLEQAVLNLAEVDQWWRGRSTPSFLPLSYSPASFEQLRRQLMIVDINASDAEGWTPLMYAATHHRPEMVRAILKAGGNPNARGRNNETALMIAVSAGRSADLIRALISGGADVNAQDRQGRTVLMYFLNRFATSSGDPEVAAMLRDSGARPDLRDFSGMTAWDYLEQDRRRASARQKQFAELTEILR